MKQIKTILGTAILSGIMAGSISHAADAKGVGEQEGKVAAPSTDSEHKCGANSGSDEKCGTSKAKVTTKEKHEKSSKGAKSSVADNKKSTKEAAKADSKEMACGEGKCGKEMMKDEKSK